MSQAVRLGDTTERDLWRGPGGRCHMRAADYVVTTSDKGKEGNMRKLLIVTAAAAGIFVSTVAVNAATPAGTYSHSKGSYALCVTNNVVDSGATQLVQISLG